MLSDDLDFRLADRGSYYTLEAQTEVGRAYYEQHGLERLKIGHDDWLKVALQLNRDGMTVRVD